MKNANPLSVRARAWLLALAALGLAGCGGRRPPTPAPARTIAHHFALRLGDQTVSVQVAVLPAEQERGLMERRGLGPDEGMIFVDLAPQQMDFWMHDTPTPLDIGFFTADGVLAEVYPLLPFDEQPVLSRRRDLQFALEMNQGWYSARGVRPGARLDLKELASALKARGFDPARFGLPSS